MIEQELKIINEVSLELGIKLTQVENTIKLFDEGATIPFISRYRKEVTGNLDEEQIREIVEKVGYYRNLEKRKEEVIRLIAEQEKLTPELEKKIMDAKKLQKVEDLYLPYKKKKKTKADIAIEQGLQPLANYIRKNDINIDNLNEEAKKYINEEVSDISKVIEGAHLILAQEISEDTKNREYLRLKITDVAMITSTLISKNEINDEKKVYQDYYDYSEVLKKIPAHRILAINRGENEKILKVNIEISEEEEIKIRRYLLNHNFKYKGLSDFLLDVIEDSLKRLLYPSIKNEIRNLITDKAEEEAIVNFSKNLENLLLQPPLYKKNILGLDPGYRTGCKLAVIDKEGFYKKSDVLFLVKGMHHERQLKEAKDKILKYLSEYDIDIIAIGNGTASRETESFVAEIIKEYKNKKVSYVIVNEAGASVYSASKLAAEEFPELDVTVRGTISISRRIQDPLAELVKIDPKSIGVGMYQHDVNQKRLNEELEETISKIVNRVGVNLNTASWALLSFVSGVKKNIAKNIVEYRRENGDFLSRTELKKVKGLGNKAFEQMAGFIVVPESKNPLDNTIIHPESYKIAETILKSSDSSIKELKNDLNSVREKLEKVDIKKIIKENDFGEETTKDIFEALTKNRRDPRDEYDQPLLKSDILKIDDLKEGMLLEGTVRNVAQFGAFIDIGLKNDALLHISQISEKFVKDPTTVLSVGEIVKVKVLSLDKARERVSLTRKNI